jgi:hypothetical protein
MDDIRPAIPGDDRRSMTYAEIAAARGISADSAVRLVRRKRWSKQAGNDGTVRVLVPANEATPASTRTPRGQPGGYPAGHPLAAPADILPVILGAIREVMQPLSEQIEAANRRADNERERADDERTRADRERDRADSLAQQLAAVEGELIGVRVEAAGLRCKLKQQAQPPPEPPRSAWQRFLTWRR